MRKEPLDPDHLSSAAIVEPGDTQAAEISTVSARGSAARDLH